MKAVYIGSAEIATVLGISVREAQYKLKAFEMAGMTVNNGRKKLISVRRFAGWLAAQDGSDINSLIADIRESLA